MVLCVDML